MPIYPYTCLNKECKHTEDFLKLSAEDKEPEKCEKCGEKMEKDTVFKSNFQLLGGGWAKDGYKGKK